MNKIPTEFFAEELQQLSANLAQQQPSWLQQLRTAAANQFITEGLPTPQAEDWKYTNVTALAQQKFKLAAAGKTTTINSLAAKQLLQDKPQHLLVFSNGHYVEHLSQLGALPAGTVIGSLATVLAQPPIALVPYFGQLVAATGHGFSALNLALAQDGAFIYLPPGTQLNEPIQLLFIVEQGEAEGPIAIQARNLIIAAEDSACTVIENYQSTTGQKYFNNTVTEIYVEKAATINHYKIQQESQQAYHIGTVAFRQADASLTQSFSLALGGALARSDTHCELNGAGSSCELNGLYLLRGKQHIDHHTSIVHQHAETTSQECYKGVLTEQSRAVFNGKVVVGHGIEKIVAEQINKNLLLSAQAEIDTKPQLEIYANDVKCTHGATVGQLNADAVFYCRARGLSLEAAQSLLTYAFVSEMLERVAVPELQVQLKQMLADTLPASEVLRGTLL